MVLIVLLLSQKIEEDPLLTSRLSYQYAEDVSFYLDKGHDYEGTCCDCLGNTKGLHWILQFGVPLVILGNVAMFASSVMATGASVYPMLMLNGTVAEHIRLPTLIEFSQYRSICDMWNAHVVFLALIATVTSLIWPHVKLSLMFLSWVSPTVVLSRRRRGQILSFLDTLGKWSFLDTYLLIMMMVGLRLGLRLPINSPSPLEATAVTPSQVELNVYVQPQWAFYLFMAATMLSLATSHVILGCHRYLLPSFPSFPGAKKRSLSSLVFLPSSKLNCCGPLVVVVLIVCSMGFLSYGALTESIQFSFHGAIGVVLQFLHEKTETNYSMLSIGTNFPDCSENPDEFGTRFVQIFFYTFAFAVPLMHLASLLFLWVVPLKSATQRGLYYFIEILNAWSTADVLVLTIITAVFEVKQFVQYILDGTHKCDVINLVLEKYFYKDLDGDTKCIDMTVSFLKEFWILLAACLFYLFVSNLVMIVAHRELLRKTKNSLNINSSW